MTDEELAEVFPPGEFIQEELDARGWTATDLAVRMGCSTSFVADLLAGRVTVTLDTAKRLGQALDTSHQLWLNLESSFQRGRAAVQAKT